MDRPPFFTTLNGRLWEVDLTNMRVTDVQSGLIIDFVEDRDAKGVWDGLPKTLQSLDGKGISLTEVFAILGDGHSVFLDGIKRSKRE
jgi:hypothetical protein